MLKRRFSRLHSGVVHVAKAQDSPRKGVLVLTHHKCASTFLRLYLDEFARTNELTLCESHYGTAKRADGSQITYLNNAVYASIAEDLNVPALHIIRNPLDLLVSAYWSHRGTHAVHDWPALQDQRDVLQKCGHEEGLFLTLAFIEGGEFYPETPGPLMAMRAWRYDDPRIRTVRMEDMVKDVNSSIGDFLADSFDCPARTIDAERFTFERMSNGRKPGEIDPQSHYRAGLPGEWRATLPAPIVAYIRTHYRHVLERYYPDALD